MPTVSITIDEPFHEQIDELWLRSIAEQLLELVNANGELEIVVTDDDTIAELNETYHEGEGPTDVLSFNARGDEDEDGEDDFVWPPDVEVPLGEIILCYPVAQRQAPESGRTVEQELAFLLTHGVLHLLGHDHMEDDERATMQGQETTLLAEILKDDGTATD